MKNIKSYFLFSKEQRNGIFLLVLIIITIQASWYFYNTTKVKDCLTSKEEKQWLAMQSQVDSLKAVSFEKKYEIKPFNPNFITDYKGYKLGMSVAEIDRLLAFRKTNQYVNSAKEFQNITKVSDSLLATISPYFKFPDWVTNKKEPKEYVKYEKASFYKKEKISIIDINTATQDDLMKINGIGPGFSERIINFRESLGGFVSMEQMQDVWGLPPDVITKLNANFKIVPSSHLKKIDINNASLKEIAQFPYFRYAIAKEIVTYRSMNGDIKNVADLTKIKGLSIEKATIIALYLTF
ncbi:helix-hairpin-helix domain-containing protein [Flavobacterium sp. NG2]|uniref:ComEA family DNA-binding protein n=1 Tax=Flavobacterium sp. NG2 TaxID=3097547 RepID=UPI002A805C6E|nr:helix-hairpin-helix domain-containing protein [Flavobacterium sp. NG2]WPR72829.1 helix-hairpin-helix domain-containing protein [Flavobacterium sp. NG2]